jgi:putative transposase
MPLHSLRMVSIFCERFHKTILNEFYQIAFREKLYATLGALQSYLDEWLAYYKHQHILQGTICFGRTSMETLLAGKTV